MALAKATVTMRTKMMICLHQHPNAERRVPKRSRNNLRRRIKKNQRKKRKERNPNPKENMTMDAVVVMKSIFLAMLTLRERNMSPRKSLRKC